jgi:hypothetical protein
MAVRAGDVSTVVSAKDLLGPTGRKATDTPAGHRNPQVSGR